MSKTYTVGRLLTGERAPAGMSYPRELLCDGAPVAVVDSCSGPVVIGDMTEERARSAFPGAFASVCRETGRAVR